MKKTFKYLLSLVAVVAVSMAFTACTNEDDVDFGPVGTWSVNCTKVTAPGWTAEQTADLQQLMNKVACLDQTLADPVEDEGDSEDEEKEEPLDLTKLSDKSETQAKYYLNYAMETAYQYINNDETLLESLPDGAVITFTLYRISGSNRLVSNTATVSKKDGKLSAAYDYTISLKK